MTDTFVVIELHRRNIILLVLVLKLPSFLNFMMYLKTLICMNTNRGCTIHSTSIIVILQKVPVVNDT